MYLSSADGVLGLESGVTEQSTGTNALWISHNNFIDLGNFSVEAVSIGDVCLCPYIWITFGCSL